MKTWVEISASAVKHNMETARRAMKEGARLCCTVKANAYGHGFLEVAKLAQEYGADWLAADSVEEGIVLRDNGIKIPVLVLGYVPLKNLAEAVQKNLSLTVYNPETIDALPAGAKIHIKVETGTGRQGVPLDQLSAFTLRAWSRGLITEGLSTHFANVGETANSSYAMEQLQKFNQAKEILASQDIQPICHTACSAAIFLFPETHFDMTRLGISLYGLWSIAPNLKPNTYNLKPVLTWKTIIAQLKSFLAGAPIGYGLTERLKRPSRVAVLPIGYFDGYDRKLSSVGEVLVSGQRCKVLGRVCMNMTMVDVTDVPDVKIEDEVVLIGKQGNEEITAEELAKKIGTINYEVVTRINPLIRRLVKD